MRLHIMRSGKDGLEILTASELGRTDGNNWFENEDEAARVCDELTRQTEKLHIVYANIYSTTFGWIQSNRKLWEKDGDILLNTA